MDIGHKNIKDYILDECNAEQLEQIEKLKNKNPTYKHLLNIIDELKHNSKPDIKDITRDIPESFSEIDSIILNIQSGSVDESFAQNFLSWLIQSPPFFEKLYTKLDQVFNLQSETDLPELQEVAIKSDEEILQQAGIFAKSNEMDSQSIIENVKTYINDIIDNIADWFQEKPKLAYSVISILVISITSPLGIRYYNTSYQLILAENLLQDNYRIYMSDTPRLSGGYESTGISMLMSDEEEKDSYLDDALEKTKIADNYDSEIPEVKRLQAQIYFIHKQYNQTDSVLNLIDKNERNSAPILNDLGVLKYSIGDIEKSIQYFESTIKSDPIFNEAYYNLALAKSKIGKNDESISLLNQFLKIEKDEGWRNAALNLIEKLKH